MKYIRDFEFGSHEKSTVYQGVLYKEVLYNDGVVYMLFQTAHLRAFSKEEMDLPNPLPLLKRGTDLIGLTSLPTTFDALLKRNTHPRYKVPLYTVLPDITYFFHGSQIRSP